MRLSGRFLRAIPIATLIAAASWVDLGPTKDKSHVYLDIASIESSKGTRWVWLKYDFSRVPTEIARYSIKRVEMRCYDRTFRFVASTDYAPSGSILFSGERTDLPFNAIVPDSVGAQVYDLVCR